ncbi:MAG: DUF2490 domain-containing protein [Gammaproteobacteria bacterium]
MKKKPVAIHSSTSRRRLADSYGGRVPAPETGKDWRLPSLIGLALLLAADACADSTQDVFGTWNSLMLTGNFGSLSPEYKKFRWLLMEQVRTRDDSPKGTRFSENLIWAQLGYDLNDYASVWVGYTHDWIDRLDKPSVQESRPYQDLLLKFPLFDGSILSRSRFEQRISHDGGEVGLRARQWLQYSHPLGFISDKLSLYLGDEALFYLNDNPFGDNGFAENRALAGFGFQFTRHFGADLGYTGQFVVNKSGRDLFTHNLNLNLRYQF